MNTELPQHIDAATLSWVTPQADDVVAFNARMSSTHNQERMAELDKIDTPEARRELDDLTSGLINFCMTHGHVSILEQVCMSVYIKTSRAISLQLLRHSSFSFQQFSQRYAKQTGDLVDGMPEFRMVDGKLRNPSVKGKLQEHMEDWVYDLVNEAQELYDELLREGVHPESARFILPELTPTTLAMTGNLRSWTFFLKNRMDIHAQAEVRYIARDVWYLIQQQCPIIAAGIQPLIFKENHHDS